MKIIEPNVELFKQSVNSYHHVAQCARICYRSEAKNENSDIQLYNALKSSGHWSMFRHETVYAICEYTYVLNDVLLMYIKSPYIDYMYLKDTNIVLIVTNMNFMFDLQKNDFVDIELGESRTNKLLYETILANRYNEQEFLDYCDEAKELRRFTFKIITQISTSRELNRVSPNNIAEQSTRYVYDDGTLCRPHWITKEDCKNYIEGSWGYDSNQKTNYLEICKDSFNVYKHIVDNGINKQDARGILPLDTATVCVYTYSWREWQHIIDLRYYGITGKPHPNAKIIAGMIREKLIEEGYEFRNE